MSRRRSIFDSYTPSSIIPDRTLATGVVLLRTLSHLVALTLALLHSIGSTLAIPTIFLVTLVFPARFPLPDRSVLGLCIAALSAFVLGCHAVCVGNYGVFVEGAVRASRITLLLQEIVALAVLYRVNLQSHSRPDLSAPEITAVSALIIGVIYGKVTVRNLKKARKG